MKFNSFQSMGRLSSLCLALSLVFVSQFSLASSLDHLPSDLQGAVRSGSQVMVEVARPDVPNAPWKEFVIYQKISGATPLESVAVFSDFDLHKNFFADVKDSRVVKVLPGGVLHVDYKVDLGFGVSDENRLEERLLSHADGVYRVNWNLMQESGYAKMIQGAAQFEAFEGGTLLVYSSFIFPKSSMLYNPSWGWVMDLAKKKIKSTVSALVTRVGDVKTNRAALLQQEIDLFKSYLR